MTATAHVLGHRHPVQHGHGQLPPTPPRSRATDTDTLTAQATLAITKTDNDGGSSVTGAVARPCPGTSITYTIVASNTGPVRRPPAPRSTDPLALNPAITSDTWTARGSGGATGFSASGTGTIDDSVTIPAGGSVTYTRDRPPSPPRPPAPSTNTATASRHRRHHGHAPPTPTRLTAQATLAITKTDGVSSIVAGTPRHLHHRGLEHGTVRRLQPERGRHPAGPGLHQHLEPEPARPGSPSPPATDTWTLASLPAGQSVTLELAGTVPSGATGSTYANTATASATDASTVTRHRHRHPERPGHPGHHQDRQRRGHLRSRRRRHGRARDAITYTIVVSNTGPVRRHRA